MAQLDCAYKLANAGVDESVGLGTIERQHGHLFRADVVVGNAVCHCAIAQRTKVSGEGHFDVKNVLARRPWGRGAGGGAAAVACGDASAAADRHGDRLRTYFTGQAVTCVSVGKIGQRGWLIVRCAVFARERRR